MGWGNLHRAAVIGISLLCCEFLVCSSQISGTLFYDQGSPIHRIVKSGYIQGDNLRDVVWGNLRVCAFGGGGGVLDIGYSNTRLES